MISRVRWTERALKDVARLDRVTRERILAGIEKLAESGHGNLKRLHGGEAGRFRLRIGDWRILLRHEEGPIIAVLRVLPRGSAYAP